MIGAWTYIQKNALFAFAAFEGIELGKKKIFGTFICAVDAKEAFSKE